MAEEVRSASLVEGVRFTATVALPNMAQGLFRRRRKLVAAGRALDLDGQAISFMRGLRRSYAPGPVRIRVGGKEALLLLSPRDVRRVLEESPTVFASDPDPKGKGMRHFQPSALTISRGAEWEDRRRFTEAALATGEKRHPYAARFDAVATEEIGAPGMLQQVEWADWYLAFQRLTRRVVFGDAAADDAELSELMTDLMDEANSIPSSPSPKFEPFMAKVRAYAEAGESGSLCARIARAPSTDATDTAGQVPHWFFALQDTLALNTWRALALLATHPEQRSQAIAKRPYLEACLQEAMRLWPTTAMLARETLAETEWDGATVPAGTQVLIVNGYFHRDPEHLEHADRFAPETWLTGRAGDDWSINHFSHGPQGCPGAHIALGIGTAALGAVLELRPDLRLVAGASLDPARPLPHAVDPYGLRFS